MSYGSPRYNTGIGNEIAYKKKYNTRCIIHNYVTCSNDRLHFPELKLPHTAFQPHNLMGGNDPLAIAVASDLMGGPARTGRTGLF